MGIFIVFHCHKIITINTFEPSLLLLFWVVYLEWIPGSNAAMANQSDYWGGGIFISFKRLCLMLRKDSIRIGKTRRGGSLGFSWEPGGVRAVISELWLQ